MKKLYLFILTLISILLFTPFCYADLVIAQNDGLDYNSVNKSSLSCLRKKKQKLKPYQGPNLKMKRGRLFREKVSSGQTYFLSSESQTATPEDSWLGDCRDYIIIGVIGEGENKISLYYDVTEIPANSYLKYISDTQELQIFPPRAVKAEEAEEDEEKTAEEEEQAPAPQEKAPATAAETLQALREAPKEEVETEPVKPEESKPVTVKAEMQNPDQVLPVDEPVQKTKKAKKPRKNIFIMLCFAFFLTAFIEGIVTLLFFGLNWKLVGVVAAANLVTTPILNLLIYKLQITSNIIVFILAIIMAAVEMGILALYVRKDYLKLSIFAFVANLVSFIVCTYLVNMQFWWGAINKI